MTPDAFLQALYSQCRGCGDADELHDAGLVDARDVSRRALTVLPRRGGQTERQRERGSAPTVRSGVCVR